MYICYYLYIVFIYRVSVKKGRSHGGSKEEVKENKKVLYHFANFAIVNVLLIIKNRRVSPAYCKRAIRCDRPANEVARRAGSCLLQVAMATHGRRVTLDPRSEL